MSATNSSNITNFLAFVGDQRLLPIRDAFQKAKNAFRNHEYLKALAWFHRCLDLINSDANLSIDFTDGYIDLSCCYLHFGKTNCALRYIDQVNRRNLDAHKRKFCRRYKKSLLDFNRLHSLTMPLPIRKDYEWGISITKMAVRLAPDPPGYLHFNLSVFYSACNEDVKAIVHLRNALARGYNGWYEIFYDTYLTRLVESDSFVKLLLTYFPYDEEDRIEASHYDAEEALG